MSEIAPTSPFSNVTIDLAWLAASEANVTYTAVRDARTQLNEAGQDNRQPYERALDKRQRDFDALCDMAAVVMRPEIGESPFARTQPLPAPKRRRVKPAKAEFGVSAFRAAQEMLAGKPLIGLEDLRVFAELHGDNARRLLVADTGLVHILRGSKKQHMIAVPDPAQYTPRTPEQAAGRGLLTVYAAEDTLSAFDDTKTFFDAESMRDFALELATEEPNIGGVGPVAIRYLVDLANSLPARGRQPIAIQYWPKVYAMPELKSGDSMPPLTDIIDVNGLPTRLVTNRNLCWYTQAAAPDSSFMFRKWYAILFDEIANYLAPQRRYSHRGPERATDDLVRIGSYRTLSSKTVTRLWGVEPQRFLDLMEQFENPQTLPQSARLSYNQLNKSILWRYMGDLRRIVDREPR
jgi:hypothetical protein